MQTIKKIILGPIDWFVYTVLSENQRKKIGDAFSDEQKEKIKKIVTGKKQAQRQKLKQIKYHLYNLGFTEKALREMETFYEETKDNHLKRLAAWELVLWHANQNTETGAQIALTYINPSRDNEKDEEQLRRIAILEAECLAATNRTDEAQAVIQAMLSEQTHSDLYLAAANLEPTIEKRLEWINKVMQQHELSPISFGGKGENAVYDDLQTENIKQKIAVGPKVSVILPAFKAEEGIQVAMDSILGQTWENIELLAVDDCSPDNTKAVIQAYTEKDSRVRLLSTPENSGPYVARNIALEQATGEYITINDADDWSHAEKIEHQVKHLMENKHVIANTSAHARLTEDLKLYRRGTPGKYQFPNMSSIMFRKEPVLEKVGYWDSVRFAADGEFKRRLIHTFGKNSYVDLETGPLSLPRQSVTSLTGSPAFGYNGFFMGVRKEYVESFSYHHKEAADCHYPFPIVTRPYHVPEPMWPKRELKERGVREFQLVIAGDFRIITEEQHSLIQSLTHETSGRIGLVQINEYDVDVRKVMNEKLRDLLDGDKLQTIVYGEKIQAEKMIILQATVLSFYQRYIPAIDTPTVQVIINKTPLPQGVTFEKVNNNLNEYFHTKGIWYPATEEIKQTLLGKYSDDLKEINFNPDVFRSELNVQ